MRVVLGIGNLGSRYKNNRHNVGFMLLDFFANSLKVSFKASKYEYFSARGELNNNSYLLVKPSTYVNNSGFAAQQVINKYSSDIKDLLVIYDDLNLNTAQFRIKASGGAGGHNGISSIIYHLNSNEFPRLRIGIGSGFEKGKMAEYVLTDFTEEEFKQLEITFKETKILIEDFIKGGLKQMLDTNSRLYKSDTNKN